MPAHQAATVERLKGNVKGGYFRLKPDYRDKPIREAAEAVLLEDARSELKGLGEQKVVVVAGHDSVGLPIVGWLAGTKAQYPDLSVISEHSIDTGGEI